MIYSMTGYGKAEANTQNGKYRVEIRSLNGKNADISIKTSLIPKDKELEVRKMITEKLGRGNIDLYINEENTSEAPQKRINPDALLSYYNQIKKITADTKYSELSNCINLENERFMETLFRFPDVIDSTKEELSDESKDILIKAIAEAVDALNEFRAKEGAILRKDVASRVELISNFVSEVEKYEQERVDAVKERLYSRIEDLKIQPDTNRLEQEIIFYIEKLDINEEKVRLRQHCHYFLETMEQEQFPGKKLGFIAQEMGREINTMGSKANHAEIQKWVVRMKDELEKIKEQSLNIL